MVDGQAAISNSLKTQIAQFFENAAQQDQSPPGSWARQRCRSEVRDPHLDRRQGPRTGPDGPDGGHSREERCSLGRTGRRDHGPLWFDRENGVRSSSPPLPAPREGGQVHGRLPGPGRAGSGLRRLPIPSSPPRRRWSAGVNQDALDMAMRMLKGGHQDQRSCRRRHPRRR